MGPITVGAIGLLRRFHDPFNRGAQRQGHLIRLIMVLPKRSSVPNVQAHDDKASLGRIFEMCGFVRFSGATAENLYCKVRPWPKLWERMRASDRMGRCRDMPATVGMYR
jgi:hypothetical protein